MRSRTAHRARHLLPLTALALSSSLCTLASHSPSADGATGSDVPTAGTDTGIWGGPGLEASGASSSTSPLLAQAARETTRKPAPPADLAPVRLKASPRPVTGGDPVEPPLVLSDPDGQDLLLEDLSVRVAVEGMLSLTELELRFRNPHGRRMEGRFTATLPPGATISRFAKEVNGQLMEGEVVERLRANQIYDQILQEMRDPALLEQDQGNRFSAKIFPIEANATVRLVLSYSRLLPLEDGVRTFSLPLRGLPTIGKYSFHGLFAPLPGETSEDLTGGGLEGPSSARRAVVQVLDLNEARYAPQEDLQIRWRPAGNAPTVQVLEAGDFYLASFRAPGVPEKPVVPEKGRRPWVFYVDTSASSAEGQVHRIAALEQLFAALPADEAVEVYAFDQKIVPIAKGSAAEVAKRVGAALKARAFLGGTDLLATLNDMAAQAAKAPGARFVLVSDGVATLGTTERRALIDAASKLPAKTALHALVLGAREDAETLDALVQGRGRKVSIPFTESLARSAREAAERLALPPGAVVSLRDPGALWLFPEQATDVQPGAEVITVGRLKAAGRPAARLELNGSVVLDAASAKAVPLGTFEPLLEREGYRAYLAYLADREDREENEAVRQALAREQVQVSVAHRVLVPRTTLLVLESEADYDRFGLDRRALASIATVGPAGIEVLDRQQKAQAIARVQPVTNAPEKPVDPRKQREDNGKVAVAKKPDSRSRTSPDSAGDDAPEASKTDSAAREARRNAGLLGTASSPAHGAAPSPDDPESDAEKDEEVATASGAGAAAMDIAGEVQEETLGVAAARLEGDGGPVGEFATGTVSASGRGAASPPRVTMSAPGAPPPAPAPEPAMEAPPAERAATGGDGASRRSRRSTSRGERAPQAVTEAVVLPEWTQPAVASPQELDEATRAVKDNPRARGGYNRLSEALASRQAWKELRQVALEWQAYDPENPQVYESLGEAALNLGHEEETARAFASLVEIAPSKSELLQRAGLLLLRVHEAKLAEAPLRKALELRPDRVNGHRHLALLLWQQGRIEEAAKVLEDAMKLEFPSYYGNAKRVVLEELGYVYRAWLAREPKREAEIRKRARENGADLDRADALRVTLAWETDANDVDLHVVDPNGEECYYSHKNNESGLELYEDITRGLGPEVVRSSSLISGTYYVGVNYFSAGPMGVSRGVLVVLQPDGRSGESQVRILPFRLVEGGKDMRLLAAVEVSQAAAKVTGGRK